MHTKHDTRVDLHSRVVAVCVSNFLAFVLPSPYFPRRLRRYNFDDKGGMRTGILLSARHSLRDDCRKAAVEARSALKDSRISYPSLLKTPRTAVAELGVHEVMDSVETVVIGSAMDSSRSDVPSSSVSPLASSAVFLVYPSLSLSDLPSVLTHLHTGLSLFPHCTCLVPMMRNFLRDCRVLVEFVRD